MNGREIPDRDATPGQLRVLVLRLRDQLDAERAAHALTRTQLDLTADEVRIRRAMALVVHGNFVAMQSQAARWRQIADDLSAQLRRLENQWFGLLDASRELRLRAEHYERLAVARRKRIRKQAKTVRTLLATSSACEHCDGCGRVASTDAAGPFMAWTKLPVGYGLAVAAGIVRPLPCPKCSGSGKAPR